MKDKHTIEFGAKYVNRNLLNNYNTENTNPNIFQPFEQFDYTQNIAAIYLSTKWELSKELIMISGTISRREGTFNIIVTKAWTLNDVLKLIFLKLKSLR